MGCDSGAQDAKAIHKGGCDDCHGHADEGAVEQEHATTFKSLEPAAGPGSNRKGQRRRAFVERIKSVRQDNQDCEAECEPRTRCVGAPPPFGHQKERNAKRHQQMADRIFCPQSKPHGHAEQ